MEIEQIVIETMNLCYPHFRMVTTLPDDFENKTIKEVEKRIKKLNIPDISHRFIKHHEKTNWGYSIHMMEKSGKAYARTYWYNDDKSVIFLEGLHVDEKMCGNGIATKLLEMHIQIAKEKKASTQLKVEEGSWMHEWYKRRGYKKYTRCEESNTIWLYMLP